MDGPRETISVTADVANLLRDVVETQGYVSASDAIRDALLARSLEDGLGGYTPDEIARLADEGIASGPGRMSLDAIQREGFRRANVPFPEG